MPRKKKTGGSPKPKDTKTQSKGRAVKQAQRAVERTKPPKPKGPTISSKAGQAGRNRPIAARLQKLEIIQDVASWIKQGLPDVEVARRIRNQGFLEDISLRLLQKDIQNYRTQVLKPADVMSQKLSKGVVEAARELEEGVEELVALNEEYQNCKKRLGKLDKIIGDFIELMDRVVGYQDDPPLEELPQSPVIPEPEVLFDALAEKDKSKSKNPGSDEKIEKKQQKKTGRPPGIMGGAMLARELINAWGIEKVNWKPPAEIAVMTREDAVRYLLVSGPGMKSFQAAVKESNALVGRMTDIAVASAHIKDQMGMLAAGGPSDSSAVLEARYTEMVIKKYPGQQEMQNAFLDTKTRAKALSLVKRVLTRRQLHDEAVIDVPAEPVKKEGGDA